MTLKMASNFIGTSCFFNSLCETALKIYAKGQMVNTEKQQVDKLTDHFVKVFEKANQQTPTYFSSCKNTPPFTPEEMQMAVKKLKKLWYRRNARRTIEICT